MSKKKFNIHLVLTTEEAMIGALNRHVEISLDLERRTAKHEKAIAELNTKFDEENQERRDELAALETSLQLFAENNRAVLFADPKSREYTNATIGFRLNPPAVERRIEKEKWETIAARIEQLSWGEPYVKSGKVTVQKDAILRDRAKLTPEQMADAGIKIEQAETFFIDPKAESIERITKETAAA